MGPLEASGEKAGLNTTNFQKKMNLKKSGGVLEVKEVGEWFLTGTDFGSRTSGLSLSI